MYSDVLCHRCHCNACALSELMQSQVQQMDGAELNYYMQLWSSGPHQEYKRHACSLLKILWHTTDAGKYFYQPAAREAHSRLVLRLLCGFRVCIYVCASALITCAIITSRILLPCDRT